MTDIDPTHVVPRLSRRRALAGAAWSAPVVVMVTSAPAHAAASPSPATLTIAPGATAAEPADVGGEPYFDLIFTGLSITVPGAPLESGQLMLTATFAPTTTGGAAALTVYGQPDDPWVITPAAGESNAVTMVLGRAVASGEEVLFPNGDFFGTASPAAVQSGSFVLTAAAPGYTSDTRSFATGPAPQNRALRRVQYKRPQA